MNLLQHVVRSGVKVKSISPKLVMKPTDRIDADSNSRQFMLEKYESLAALLEV